jgi:hypothetical protein
MNSLGPRQLCIAPRARGGLASWQKRIVIDFIEENLVI